MNATYPLNHQVAFSAFLNKALRLSTSASLAVLITGMLLYLMCALIAMESPEIITDSPKIIEVVMMDDRKIIDQTEKMVIKPVEPTESPQRPEIIHSIDPGEGIEISMAPTLDPGVQDITGGSSSGTAMPIFKVAPQYPRRQLSRGVEGFVDLLFDITATGKTVNIRVTYSQPEGAFDRASIKALAKWKYKPAKDDGMAIAQLNQTTRIVYELEK